MLSSTDEYASTEGECEYTVNIPNDLAFNMASVNLLEKIGQGSYGEVWKADLGPVLVAVKKICVGIAVPETIELLEHEFTIAAKLRHPNIVYVFGACAYSPTELWIVMEFAEEGSLYSLLSNTNIDIPWSKKWKWINSAAAAISFLHMQGIVHRDIKSPNFLLLHGDLKLTDFGMSAASMTSVRTLTTRDSTPTVGTIHWLAPECSDLKPVYDERSDIYSLGVLFWEIISQKIPFEDSLKESQVIYLVKDNQRPEIPPDCPHTFAAIIKKCWAASPYERPTGAEVVQYLHKHKGLAYLSVLLPPIKVESKKSVSILQEELEATELLGIGSATSYKGTWHTDLTQVPVVIRKMKDNAAVKSDIQLAVQMQGNTVNNRNMCKIHGFCEVKKSNELWLVTEYISGLDLHTFLKQTADPLPEAVQISFFIQASTALVTLHSFQPPILHQDIKSSNFLVRDNSLLLLTDIGLAQSKSLYNMSLASLSFVAPEILAAEVPQWTDKADIYSLGIVFYEIATKLPYNGSLTVNHHWKKITKGPPKLPSKCPTHITQVIQLCLQINPSKRPSARELLSRLYDCSQTSVQAAGHARGTRNSLLMYRKRDKETNRQDKKITKELRVEQRDKKKYKTVKLLLLGAGESGKSTLLKQLKLLYLGIYTDEECRNTIPAVHRHILGSFKEILQGAKVLKLKLSNNIQDGVNNICSLPPHQPLTPAIALLLKQLQSSTELAKLFKKAQDLQIHSTLDQMMTRIDEIASDSYIPTVDDILKTRTTTTGINEFNYEYGGMAFSILDMGGQRSERRKWIAHFENVTAVMYVLALNEYDMRLREDPNVNRMHESLSIFKNVINNKFLQHTAIIMILNKTDLFREKIERSDLRVCFPDFSGKQEYVQAMDFIVKKFQSFDMNQHRNIFVHPTCMLDTNQISTILADIKLTLIQRVLKEIGILM